MKKLFFLLSFSFCYFVASAQPTSIGGITPGKTTPEELKELVQTSEGIGGVEGSEWVHLKQPEGQSATVSLQNGVVYQVSILLLSEGVKQALVAKYGQPRMKVGGIRIVNCQNKFGGIFKRYQGEETRFWPVKDGVQGKIEYLAGNCADSILETYVVSHVATLKAIVKEDKEKARKEAQKQRSKLEVSL